MINAYCQEGTIKILPHQMRCHSNLNVFRNSLKHYKKLQVKAWKQADGIYLHLPQFLALEITPTSVGVSRPSC